MATRLWMMMGLACATGLWGCDDAAQAVDAAVFEDASAGGEGGTGGEGGAGATGGTGGAGPVEIEGDCDPLNEGSCAFPWPSSRYLQADPARVTGYTLAFGPESLPKSAAAGHIQPEPWRRMDGYGLGVALMVAFPNLDTSAIAGEANIEDSLADDAPVLIFEVGVDTLRRVPYWAELDANEVDPAKQTLWVRPGEILRPNTRYIAAFRNLQTTAGEAIPPSEAFAALRDGATADDGRLAPRQGRFDEIFAELSAAGVDSAGLVLAWDFHTASSEALTGTLLKMRDDALAATEDRGPELSVDEVIEFAATEDAATDDRPYNPYIAYRLSGLAQFPNYMRETPVVLGSVGYEFNRDAAGDVVQDGVDPHRWWAIIPRMALDGTPVGLVSYGHGLFGDGEEVLYPGWTRACGRFPNRECGWFNARIAENHGRIYFGTDLLGMSEVDRDERALTILTDVSLFPWIADRVHQGITNYITLGRAMKTRFAALPEVAALNLTINTDDLVYSGISQGAIFGAAVVAVSPDITRGHLGVAGANYLTLLHRSTGFVEFFAALKSIYPDSRDQAVVLGAMQLLWDGTDSISYLRHLSAEPFDGQAPSHILATVTSGDYLVTPLAYEVAARTPGLGLGTIAPYDDRRQPALVTLTDAPHTGSGLVHWWMGNPWVEPGNTPPAAHTYGDPHDSVRHSDAHSAQMAHFWATGEIIDTCNGVVCPDVDRSVLDD
jgi:hypothetical protein